MRPRIEGRFEGVDRRADCKSNESRLADQLEGGV
jgi:hypothetical protein